VDGAPEDVGAEGLHGGDGGAVQSCQARDWRTASEKRGTDSPDYYWADPETGEIKCNSHCLWEEIK
jgi:hypothetical protein